MSEIKTIAVLGAGAIGGWMAAKLHADSQRAGTEVSLIARGEALEAVQARGLTLLSNTQQQIQQVLGQSADFLQKQGQKFDLIVVAVKSQSMGQAAAAIAPLLHAKTIVLTAMNGVPWWFLPEHPLQSVDAGGVIAGLIPRQQVMGCVVHAGCSTDAPGVVRHHFGNGLIVGEAAGGLSARLTEVVGILQSAGFEATESDFIQRDVWYKLWGNMTMGPISAITGATMDKILADDLVRDFASAVMLEAKEIGARIGIPIAQSPEERHALTAKLGAFKTSMLQDVLAGRSVELDALLTSVHELGQRLGQATPNIAALLGLTRLMARERGLYPHGRVA